jgi:uncharacterized protein YndB with AHSA1/START domain
MPLSVTTPSDREVVIVRDFDAPRDLVWDCHTKPELVRRWLIGPPGWSMPVCEIDLRVGGKYRYVLKGPNGEEMGFGGTYRELVRPELMASTEIFDQDWTGGETQSSTRFDEARGRTKVTVTILYTSKEARDGAIATGMAEGMESGFQNLDALLVEMTAA